ncbi:hypothetical protein [uncultured Microscilla sp.]|uniref:hypothetical protein n=1 Tax=uncultured Microscilla sp. TaxID=432653 RepID=UPI00262A4912|nr:hypothetical protein [uncultured Microscilla sp.]
MKIKVKREENEISQKRSIFYRERQKNKNVLNTVQPNRNIKPVVSDKTVQAIYAKYAKGSTFPYAKPLHNKPRISKNTPKKQEKKKKHGLVGVTEPEEFKKAITYLKQSPTATKVINYLENLKVITKVQTGDSSRFDLSKTEQVQGENLIRWYSHTGLVVNDAKGAKDRSKKRVDRTLKTLGYQSPALGLIHEMTHAAIEHGYLETYGLTLEENVDKDKHNSAEHKFIVALEWQVIDELKKADKNNKETKREYYNSASSHILMKDGPTSADSPIKDIFDLYSRDELRRLMKVFKERKEAHKKLYESNKN